jgi:hypothetical protein
MNVEPLSYIIYINRVSGKNEKFLAIFIPILEAIKDDNYRKYYLINKSLLKYYFNFVFFKKVFNEIDSIYISRWMERTRAKNYLFV